MLLKIKFFSPVIKLDFAPLTNSLLATLALHFLLKPLVCNKNITSGTKMNQVVFLVWPLHFLPLTPFPPSPVVS